MIAIERGQLRITCLVADTTSRGDLDVEHGLSFHVEAGEIQGLLDTGQSSTLMRNAAALGVDLGALSWVALSHGHYDHTGGLGAIMALNPRLMVHAHPAVFAPKFSRDAEEGWLERGADVSRESVERACALSLSQGAREICPGVVLTGEIPRVTDFEQADGRFWVEQDGVKVPDTMPDDQALVLGSSQGLVVLLGCAHSGVVNTLECVKALTKGAPLAAVVGGMHLKSASEDRIGRTVDAMRAMGVCKVGVTHCTGALATMAFADAFGDNCFACPAGTVMVF